MLIYRLFSVKMKGGKRNMPMKATPTDTDTAICTGYEALSRPFRYVLEYYPDDPPDLESLAGKPHTVNLPLPDGTTRPLNGIVFRAERGPSTVRSARYGLELRPWFLLLDRERTCAVFQDMSVPEIVTKVCNEAGFGNLRNALTSSYAKREYTVRYGETSFAFLSRLMAEAGIFYFFEHDASSHTLVMADSLGVCTDCAQGSTLAWLPGARGEDGKLPDTPSAHIFEVSLSRRTVPASCSVDDYNPLTPSTRLAGNAGGGAFPCLGFPMAGHTDQQSGEALAGIRLDACEAGECLLHGASSCPGLSAGCSFSVSGHPDAQANAAWVASEVRFTATFPGNGAENTGRFLAEVTAMPASVRYRPLPAFPRPRLGGPLTGVVTGKENEPVWTDQHGRCKIRFQWQGVSDDTSSCWVRVAQPWTGNGYGAQFLPRVGQEVVVSFLGGDPDRPLVTGMVYNSGNPPPWSLPENATCSGLLTRSLPDGEAGNELRFDDKKDEELVYLHAQKTLACEVENARTVTILGEGGDSLTLEKSSRITTIKEGDDTLRLEKGNRSISLKEGDDSFAIEKGGRSATLTEGDDALTLTKGNRSVTLTKGDLSVTLSEGNDALVLEKGSRSVELRDGDESVSVRGNRRIETGGDEERTHDGKVVIKVKGDYTLKVSGNLTIEAGGELKLKSSGKTSLEAGSGVSVDSSAELALSAQTELSAKAAMVGVKASGKGEIDGGALLVVKGGLVKIN